MHTTDSLTLDLDEMLRQIEATTPEDEKFNELWSQPIDFSGLPHYEIIPTQQSVAISVETPDGPTQRITIRLPTEIYVAYKVAALRRGIGYQPLIVEVLREAMNQPRFP